MVTAYSLGSKISNIKGIVSTFMCSNYLKASATKLFANNVLISNIGEIALPGDLRALNAKLLAFCFNKAVSKNSRCQDLMRFS